jgi:hypothetical protein
MLTEPLIQRISNRKPSGKWGNVIGVADSQT